MKKIINKPENVVEEMLHGLAMANPAVIHSEGLGVISRKEKSKKVGVVSGGGSGHEPAHAGYVGKGMLDAAVAGIVLYHKKHTLAAVGLVDPLIILPIFIIMPL